MDSERLPERFDDLPPKERIRVLKAGSAMTHFVFKRAAAVLIASPKERGQSFNSGSSFVLRLDGTHYLGTAWHVVTHWREAMKVAGPVNFQVGRMGIDPDARLAWKDEKNDLAFLRLTQAEAERTDVEVCEPILGWPPPHPAVGAYLLMSGFPGTERRRPADDEVDFGAFSSMMQVTVSHDRYVVCQFQREHWVSEGRESAPPNSDLGGMSGGPALLVRNVAYPLVGLISEFSRDFELLYVKTLSHLPSSLG